MRWYVFGQDKFIADWVSARIKGQVTFTDYAAIGLCEDDRILAGVVYHNYIPEYRNIEMSVASESPRWATKDSLKTFFKYPFVQLKCGRVTATTRESNKQAIRFNQGIGFKREGVIRRGYGKENMVIFGMLSHECKWIGE